MSVSLEHRRLAIARAFREARTTTAGPPAESLGPVQPHDDLSRRLQDVEHAVNEVRLQVAHVMSRLDEPGDTEVAEEPEDPDGGAEAASRPSVPPLELAGLMSPVASRALFGHS